MNIIFISETAQSSFIDYMKSLGHVVLIPKDPRIDSRISSHPDLVLSIVDNNLIIDENASESIFSQLDANAIPYIKTSSNLGSMYPNDIPYNAVVTKNFLIHNLSYTNPLLLEHCKNTGKKLLHVKQGYSKCSTVVIDDEHLITSDQGIYNAVKEYMNVLLISTGFVDLEGFDYGFLGGCSGTILDTVVFHGDLSKHPDFLRIKEFIEAAGKKLVYFTDFTLRDIGSILVLETRKCDKKDDLVLHYKKHVNIPIFISHEGCPNDCVFCNQRKITAKAQAMTLEEVKEQIENYCSTLDDNTYIELAFFGGSFTGIAAPLQEMYLSLAYKYKQSGIIHAIRLSTRPDYINKEILDRLKRYTVDIIELGVQSLDNEVLSASKRGHVVSDLYNAVSLIKSYGFQFGIQLMLGLPKDTKQRCVRSASLAALLNPDCVRIYPTLVIKETELASLSVLGQYSPLSLDTAVEWAKKMYEVFLSSQIPVIRMGLQPTELIAEGKEVLHGPFHPALRQLVESSYFYDKIKKMLVLYKEHISALSNIKILCNPKDLSQVIGHKRKNFLELKKEYPNLQIIPDSKIRQMALDIELYD